jgi:acetolactate synthase-1/2/3 large subunit
MELDVLLAAELVVAIGVDPVELIPGPWRTDAPVIALGEWPVADRYFGKVTELVGPLPSLIALVAEHLHREFDGVSPGRGDRLRSEERLLETPADGIGPQHVVLAARAAAPLDATATIDSGAHMLVAMPLWEVREVDQVSISSGLATMGFALPAAVAASLARPGRQVIALTGDGGVAMCLGEFETLARLRLPVTVVVFNDSALSLIEVKQRPGQGGTRAVRYGDSDFAAIGRAFGVEGRRVDRREDLASAFAQAFAEPRPFVLDVLVDPSGYPHVMTEVRGGPRG